MTPDQFSLNSFEDRFYSSAIMFPQRRYLNNLLCCSSTRWSHIDLGSLDKQENNTDCPNPGDECSRYAV
jgi:hypothetical protein